MKTAIIDILLLLVSQYLVSKPLSCFLSSNYINLHILSLTQVVSLPLAFSLHRRIFSLIKPCSHQKAIPGRMNNVVVLGVWETADN